MLLQSWTTCTASKQTALLLSSSRRRTARAARAARAPPPRAQGLGLGAPNAGGRGPFLLAHVHWGLSSQGHQPCCRLSPAPRLTSPTAHPQGPPQPHLGGLAGTVEGGLSRPRPHSWPSLCHCPLEPRPSHRPGKHAWHWAFSTEQMQCLRATGQAVPTKCPVRWTSAGVRAWGTSFTE